MTVQNTVSNRSGNVSGALLAIHPGGPIGGALGYLYASAAGTKFKHSPNKYIKRIATNKFLGPAGAGLGAMVGGGLGFALGKSMNNPAPYVEKFKAKIEKRHEKAIDKIEGWD
jgi:hypothetical protein